MSLNTSENNKRIAKNTLLLYFRMLLIMLVNLYISRVVLDILGVEDYGIYNVVGGFVTMFSVISGAMTTATQRFLSFEIGKNENGNVQTMFTTAIMIHVFLAIIIFILGESVGIWFLNSYMNFPSDRYFAANCVFQFSLLTFIVNVMSVPYNAAIVAYERMKAFAYVSIIEAVSKLMVVYLLLVSPIDKLIFYAALLALISILIRIIYSTYCRKNFKDCSCNWKWNREHGKNVMSFVSWNLIGSVAGIAKEQGVNVLLNIFFGASVNAARGVAYQVLNAMNGFVNNFLIAINPQIVKSYASNEKESMFKLVLRGSRISFLMITTLAIPIIIEAPFILSIWLKEVPEYTAIFLRLVLLTSIVDSLSGTLITSMHASGKVRDYQIIVGGISLLTLPMAYVLLKMNYPPYSAMIVGLILAIICHFVRLILLKKSIGFPIMTFIKQVTLRVSILFVLALLIPLIIYINLAINWLSFLLIVIVSFISSIFLAYIIGLDRKEKDFILEKIRKIK